MKNGGHVVREEGRTCSIEWWSDFSCLVVCTYGHSHSCALRTLYTQMCII